MRRDYTERDYKEKELYYIEKKLYRTTQEGIISCDSR